MVTVAEAQAQVAAARKELDEARTQGQARKAEIKLAKAESQRVLRREVGIGTVTSQALIRQRVGRGGVGQEITRRRRRARRAFVETGAIISGAQQELTAFESQFPGREAQIAGVQEQIAITREFQSDVRAAEEAVARGSLKPGASKRTTRLFEQAIGRRIALQPTLTEVQLQQSLPLGIRVLSAEEVAAGIPGSEIFTRQSFLPPVQTIAPPISPVQLGPVQQLGGVILSRRELEELRQQSLPLGTTGIIPQEQVRRFGPQEFVKELTPRTTAFLTTEIPPLVAARRGVFGLGTRISAGVPGVFDIAVPSRRERILLGQQPVSLGARGLGLGVRGVSEFIPTTPLGVGVLGAGVAATLLAPSIIAVPVLGAFTALGVVTALDPRLTIEQRVGGGIVAGLGVVGIGVAATPFVRGLGVRGIARAPEGFELVPGVRGIGDIGLIQPGGARPFIDLPRGSPLRGGAFGRRPGGEAQFLGPGQILATSQRGLFEPGVDVPIQRPFFVTPQEPTLGIGITRVSRLGLVEPFTPPTSIQIGFGIPPPAQIGITVGRVARAETRGAFAIGRGSELEAIRTTGIITGVRGLGRVRIGGQGVDIFAFEIGRGPSAPVGFRFPSARQLRTTLGTTRVSGEGLLASFGVRPTRGITSTVRSRGLISSRVFGRTRPVTTTDIFGTGRVSPPTVRTPPTTTGISGISLLPLTFGLPTFAVGLGDFFPTQRPPRRRRDGRRRERRIRIRGPGIQAQLAPSFTAIAADLRGSFPTELRIGGISPRQIRVLPRRRRRR